MLGDVLGWAAGKPTAKLISKETLNHAGLIQLASGLDVYRHTRAAYRLAYQALGIDLLNRVPLEPAPAPTAPGTVRPHPSGKPYDCAPLGIYDTVMRRTYACATPEEIYALDMAQIRYDDLLTPVPHPVCLADSRQRQAEAGAVGLYFPMLYTTLFMWAVEVLGWETFMVAATLEPDRFHDHFLAPCAAKSRAIVHALAEDASQPFLFVHDDLASATGPTFRPAWYDRYIFPHYPDIWGAAKQHGQKIIFVADGNMTHFLPQLLDAGVDGIMFESPATPLEAVIEHFGAPGRFFIGGISTRTLAIGSPEEVRRMVFDLYAQAGDHAGFAVAAGGGLHGDLPLENLEAYFDARAEIGATPINWRYSDRSSPGREPGSTVHASIQ